MPKFGLEPKLISYKETVLPLNYIGPNYNKQLFCFVLLNFYRYPRYPLLILIKPAKGITRNFYIFETLIFSS